MRFITFIFLLAFYSESFSQNLVVQSTAFANTHYIPYRYTCDAENISPALRISGIPGGTKSLVLIMLDTSAAFGVFDHWLVWNIPPTGKIEENSSPGVTGWNSRKENKYTGPCPPNGLHEYHFRIYALDTFLNLSANNGKEAVLKAMRGHVLDKGELVGLFQKRIENNYKNYLFGTLFAKIKTRNKMKKKSSIIIIACVVSILVSCQVKSEREEENLYNPYDTSDLLDTFNFSADTIYTMDSVAKSFKLREMEKD